MSRYEMARTEGNEMQGFVTIWRSSLAAGAVLGLTGVGSSWAGVVLTSSAHISPFKFAPPGPPNQAQAFTDWNANAIQGLMQGDVSVGNPANGPAAYYPVTTVNQRDVFDSVVNSPTFPSWRGIADPAAPFNTSYGNAVDFSLRIVGNGTQFKLSNLDNTTTSNDTGNDWSFGSHLSANRNYASTRVGINYGPDHLKGTADDIVYQNNESGALPVDELDYSGVGVAQDVLDPAFGVTPGTHQQDIDRSVAVYFAMHAVTQISNTFMLKDDAGALLGQATASVNVVPEPVSGLLVLCGGAALGFLRRRRV